MNARWKSLNGIELEIERAFQINSKRRRRPLSGKLQNRHFSVTHEVSLPLATPCCGPGYNRQCDPTTRA